VGEMLNSAARSLLVLLPGAGMEAGHVSARHGHRPDDRSFLCHSRASVYRLLEEDARR
jgi:hypothetical protein